LLQIPAIQGSVSINPFWHGPCTITKERKEVDPTGIENRISGFLGAPESADYFNQISQEGIK